MRQHSRLPVLGAIAVAAAAFATTGLAAETSAESDRPAHVEKVEGSDIPRVVLKEQAAKRLDIQTVAVRETEAKRWILMSGKIDQVPAMATAADAVAGTSAAAPVLIKVSAGQAPEQPAPQVLLTLKSKEDDGDKESLLDEIGDYFVGGDMDDDDDNDAAIVTPVGSDDDDDEQYRARAVESAYDTAAVDRYFEIIDSGGGFSAGDTVFVGMAAPNDGDPAKVVPYSSVIYDAHGGSWLYTNPEPLVFVRQGIKIERVLGDLAVLLDGPPAGTLVVSVGAAELMGVEIGVGH